MPQARGHIANGVFAPEGALQNVGSADFFGLGYEPFGSLLPGRNYSSDAYRFGFNGMEKDDEVHGATGTSYDFGARLYDPRVGRWLSVDPLAMKNPYHSPYIGMNDNPILFADPDGMSGEVTINKESKTVTVMAVYAFYGTQSSPQIAKAYAAQIQNSFNDAHGLVTIDNVEYKVQFVIIGVDLSRFGEEAVQHVIKNNTKPMSNFIRLEPGGRTLDGASYTDHAGANTGVWSTSQVKDDVTTPAHEFNHGVNGADHPEDIDWAGGENTMDASIDMTIYSYRYVKPEYLIKDANGNYYVDVTKRKVTQGNIDAIFNEGVKKQLSKTGKAVIGDTQPANEYHK